MNTLIKQILIRFLKEAYRLLNYDGLIYIAEPTKSYDETQRAELMEINKRGI